MSDTNKLKLELDDNTLMIIGALKSNNAADVLQFFPEDTVDKILANKAKVEAKLNEMKLVSLTGEGEYLMEKAKIDMKVNMYKSFS